MKPEHPKIKIKITLDLQSCAGCPLVDIKRTPGTGYALDYFCTASENKKKIMGYIEWSSEYRPVPDWCPIKYNVCHNEYI